MTGVVVIALIIVANNTLAGQAINAACDSLIATLVYDTLGLLGAPVILYKCSLVCPGAVIEVRGTLFPILVAVIGSIVGPWKWRQWSLIVAIAFAVAAIFTWFRFTTVLLVATRSNRLASLFHHYVWPVILIGVMAQYFLYLMSIRRSEVHGHTPHLDSAPSSI